MKEIVVAGGCFWGVDAFFARRDGVTQTEAGYANCNEDNPSYERVCTQITGCTEAVRIVYDEKKAELSDLLDAFFRVIDPTVKNRQGPDIGSQYRTGLYYTDEQQKEAFEQAVKRAQPAYNRPIVTEVLPLENFWPAESYHQDYLKKNPGGYCHIPLDL